MRKVIEWKFKQSILILLLTISFVIVGASASYAQSSDKYSIGITVKDVANRDLLPGALVGVDEYQIFNISDLDGKCTLQNVPAGEITVVVRYVGYKEYSKKIFLNSDTTINVAMVVENLKISEVTVLAESNNFGKSTSSKIGRQAIDHIQAKSLADVFQLLPGNIIESADDMTSSQEASIRTLFYDKNNSYGVAIVEDGIPVMNNSNLMSNNYNTLGGGIDLRSYATDNVDNIEVITGVASVEYGDLSSGAIVVNTAKGVTPLRVRAKVDPSIRQASISKGFSVGKKDGVVNASFDYLDASGDPRLKVESFDRINTSITYQKKFNKLETSSSVKFSSLLDKSKQDPDAVADSTFTESEDYFFRLAHSGTLRLDKKFARNVKYSINGNYRYSHYHQQRWVVNSGGETAIFTSKENGIFTPIIVPPSYLTSGGSKSKPVSVFAKLSNNFYLKGDKSTHVFNMGVDYRYEQNNGIGKYNTNDSLPLYTSDTRPVPYNYYPALTQISAYLEDNYTFEFNDILIKTQAGLRATCMQPGREEAVYELSPRLNVGVSPLKWIDARFAYGLSSKSPGTTYMYPVNDYIDEMVSFNTTGVDYYQYRTHVIEVERSDLKNSTSEKFEFGLDIKLPEDRGLNLTYFVDRNKSGFGAYIDYRTIDFDTYNVALDASGNPYLDTDNVTSSKTIWYTTGAYTNKETSINKGLEMRMSLGMIKPIYTRLYLSGAYNYSEMYSTGTSYSNPVGYSGDVRTPDMKFAYLSDNIKDIRKQISTRLDAVCNIPVLELVASATMQVVWYTYSSSLNPSRNPIGYLDNDLNYKPITNAMLADDNYKIGNYLLKDQIKSGSISDPTINKTPTWLVTTRLTKNISDFIGVSFYVNNTNYYEPWQSSSTSDALSQKNTGVFAFGLELKLTL